jgi:hypothetical protein
VAAARDYLLAKGRQPICSVPTENNRTKDVESLAEIPIARGSHVVAPVRVSDTFGAQVIAPDFGGSRFTVSS